MYLLLHSYTDAAPFRHRRVVAVVAGLAPAGPATPPLPAQLMEHLVNCNCDCQRASGLSVLGLGQVELPVFQGNSPQALEPGPRGF